MGFPDASRTLSVIIGESGTTDEEFAYGLDVHSIRETEEAAGKVLDKGGRSI
jgi:hypothetical protein